mgnify:CR=1 FL=1
MIHIFRIVFVMGLMLIVHFRADGQAFRNFRDNPAFHEEINFTNVDYERINELIFLLTNEIRESKRLKSLEYSKELGKAATMHARDMVDKKFFAHLNPYDPVRKTPSDRAKLCNISNPYVAENLIEGYGLRYVANHPVYFLAPGVFSSSPRGAPIKPHTYMSFCEAQLKGWMNSPGHKANILDKEAFQIGCGTAGFTDQKFNNMPSFYVVQNFQRFEPAKVIKQ